MRWSLVMVTLCLASLSFAASAETLSGPARVIDGDTIELAGERVRLHGIDTPEARQHCTAEGTEYPCGNKATAYLASLTLGNQVSCEGAKRDRYKRLIAVCYVEGNDLNAALVRAGWAVAYRRYSTDYVGEEEVAEAEGVGMWRGTFEMPWEWRRAH